MNKEGKKPDADGEEKVLRVVVRVLRPDDHRVETNERLDDGQDDQKCCKNFKIFLPRVQVKNPEREKYTNIAQFCTHSFNLLMPLPE